MADLTKGVSGVKAVDMTDKKDDKQEDKNTKDRLQDGLKTLKRMSRRVNSLRCILIRQINPHLRAQMLQLGL